MESAAIIIHLIHHRILKIKCMLTDYVSVAFIESEKLFNETKSKFK